MKCCLRYLVLHSAFSIYYVVFDGATYVYLYKALKYTIWNPNSDLELKPLHPKAILTWVKAEWNNLQPITTNLNIIYLHLPK